MINHKFHNSATKNVHKYTHSINSLLYLINKLDSEVLVAPSFNEKFEETYEGSPLLDYEKLKRWARWIVGREVFDKIIFRMTKICLK